MASASAPRLEPVDSSALTRFAIDGPLPDARSPFMHFFFRRLAEEGDGKRIFVARRVCRSWKKFVDGMTNVEYACIYAALCSDPILANYMDRIRLPDAFAAHSREMDPHHSFADLLKSELTQGGTSACVIDVLVWVLLDHLAKLGIDAACSEPPHRFALVYDLGLRGYSYYAMYNASKERRARAVDVEGQLHRWWRKTLERMQKVVQRTHEERNGGATEQVKRAAKASVRNFVDKMSSIAFHGCRFQNDVSFHEEGRRLVDAWAWP